jgi:signal transduction histidine kinase/ligand-binding sensor domain-containing protein
MDMLYDRALFLASFPLTVRPLSSPHAFRAKLTRWVAGCAVLGSLLASGRGETAAAGEEARRSERWLVKTWQYEDGLPSGIVSAIAQTPDGFLWLGTRFGLVRFDGVQAVPFREESGTPRGEWWITALHVGRDGRLWLGDRSGAVASLGPRGIVRHREGRAEPVSNDRVFSIQEDEAGNRWVSLASGWLRFGAEGVLLGTQPAAGGKSERVDFRQDAQGRLWAVAGSALSHLEAGALKRVLDVKGPLKIGAARGTGLWLAHHARLSRYPVERLEQAVASLDELGAAGEITALLEDRAGRLWIGTAERGLFVFAEGLLSRISRRHEQVTTLFEDREGSLWCGTFGSGLSRVRPRFVEILDTQDGLPKSYVKALATDDAGTLYAAGARWLARFSEGRFVPLGDDGPVPLGNVRSLCTTPDGSVWLGTEREGVQRRHPDGRCEVIGLRGVLVNVLLPARAGGLWIGTQGRGLAHWREGALTQFGLERGLSVLHVAALAEDREGALWLGTAGGSLFRLQQGKFTRFDPPDSFSGRTIHCFWPNDDGSLWLGTDGGGLVHFEQGKFRRIAARDGLPSDFIFALHCDARGQAWVGSAHGLFRVPSAHLAAFLSGERTDVEAFSYGRGEGLNSLVFRSAPNPRRQTADGRLWFVTRNGAVAFDPQRAEIESAPPPVYLEPVLVDGRALPPAARARLPASSGKFEFAFTAPVLAAAERVKLLYRMEGWDAVWQDGSAARHATYGRLPPGDYRFRVIARDHIGTWNRDGAAWAFTVLPAFWQTVWFRGLAAVAGAVLLAAAVRQLLLRRLRVRLAALEHGQALLRERERIAADLHDEVGASLTHIAHLSELARTEAADDPARPRLQQLAGAARRTIEIMDGIVWVMNPRNDTLARLVGYLGDYAAEFMAASGIRFEAGLPDAVPEVKLASEVRHHVLMAVKEALHNAVKHSHATRVRLRVALEERTLRIVVSDDGQGFVPGAPAAGQGLANQRARLASCAGVLDLESAPGHGTTVAISLPLPHSAQP